MLTMTDTAPGAWTRPALRSCGALVNLSKSPRFYLPRVFVFGPAALMLFAVGKRRAPPALSPGGAFSMLQQQAKPDRQAWLCRCLRWAGWAGAGARAGGPPYLARPGLLRCVQQLRAEMPPTTARSPARAAALRAAAAGRSAEGRSCSFAAAARSSLPFDAVALKGLLHITLVIRPWNPPHLTRRITQRYVPRRHCRAHPAMPEGGTIALFLPLSFPAPVVLGSYRQQRAFRCSAGAHRAQAAQPAAGSRCSCGAGGHGARAAASR